MPLAAPPLDVASYTGSSDIPCEGIQDTPDYIRRGTVHHKIEPVELFSAPSPQEPSLTEPSQVKDAAILEVGEAISSIGASTAQETTGYQRVHETLHIEQSNCNCWGLISSFLLRVLGDYLVPSVRGKVAILGVRSVRGENRRARVI